HQDTRLTHDRYVLEDRNGSTDIVSVVIGEPPGLPRRSLHMRIIQTPLGEISRLAYRPDGSRLAVLGERGSEVEGYVVNMRTGSARPMAQLSFVAHGRYDLSPDGSRVISVWTEREGDVSSLR